MAGQQLSRAAYLNIAALAAQVLEAATAAARDYEAQIMQGSAGERAHGYDVLGWVEKLAASPSPELRAAALLHDVDRLANPAEGGGFKGERHGEAYQAHKKAHAARSASYAAAQLTARGAAGPAVERVSFLIAHHDDAGPEVEQQHDAELDALVAADVFAFFTAFAQKILQAEGEERLADKVAFMVAKLPARARQLLAQHRLPNPTFERLKSQALARR